MSHTSNFWNNREFSNYHNEFIFAVAGWVARISEHWTQNANLKPTNDINWVVVVHLIRQNIKIIIDFGRISVRYRRHLFLCIVVASVYGVCGMCIILLFFPLEFSSFLLSSIPFVCLMTGTASNRAACNYGDKLNCNAKQEHKWKWRRNIGMSERSEIVFYLDLLLLTWDKVIFSALSCEIFF